MSVQDKFFKLFTEEAENFGLEVVLEKSFANVGVIHLQRPGTFDTLLSLPFDFQVGKAHFGWMSSSNAARCPVFADRPNPYFAGFAPDELGEAIDTILDFAMGSVWQV